jgi:hypothetical protein
MYKANKEQAGQSYHRTALQQIQLVGCEQESKESIPNNCWVYQGQVNRAQESKVWVSVHMYHCMFVAASSLHASVAA